MRFFASRERKKGFTLIEVAVVVAVVSIVATVVLVNVQNIRQNARDKERLTELKQLELALRLYKDANGVYPLPGCAGTPDIWTGAAPLGDATFAYNQCEEYISGLVPDYLPALPRDAILEAQNPGTMGYVYTVSADRKEYKVLVRRLESVRLNQGDQYARCPSIAICPVRPPPNDWCQTANATYAIYSPGRACW